MIFIANELHKKMSIRISNTSLNIVILSFWWINGNSITKPNIPTNYRTSGVVSVSVSDKLNYTQFEKTSCHWSEQIDISIQYTVQTYNIHILFGYRVQKGKEEKVESIWHLKCVFQLQYCDWRRARMKTKISD